MAIKAEVEIGVRIINVLFFKLKNISIFNAGIMTATLTYTLVLAIIYFGRKAIDLIEE